MSALSLPKTLPILAALAAMPASAEGIELRAATLTMSYEDGTEGNNLPVHRTRLGLDLDLGLGDGFGIEAGLGTLANDTSGGFSFEYEGQDLFLNPYWQANDRLRVGLFYDRTQLDYGGGDHGGDLHGVTAAYRASDGLTIDGYLGEGSAPHDLEVAAVGVALNYDFGTGWAVGGHVDYEELTGTSVLGTARIGLAGSYSFDGPAPVTVTFGAVYEDTFERDTRFGVMLSIPIGPNPGPARPAHPRRGIVGGRPLT